MSTTTKAALITAALAAGTLTLWPESELPCDPGSIYMQTVSMLRTETDEATGTQTRVCTIETVGLICGDDGQPSETAFVVEPESQQIPCESLEWVGPDTVAGVHPYPIDQRYPTCLVGEVERLATGEGEFTSPAVPPYVGTCCQPGCVAAGTVEHIAPGGPQWYECTRLHRLFPDAECGGG